jgi:hypothetical protein
MNLIGDSGAILSSCNLYRYWLWRIWDRAKPLLVWVMLNPSTADANVNDPTILACIDFAKRNGYGGFIVVNLFGWRATNPAELQKVIDPVGPENDSFIFEALSKADRIVCAWGAHRFARSRAREVLDVMTLAGLEVMALQINQDGSPKHPLYVRRDTNFVHLDTAL